MIDAAGLRVMRAIADEGSFTAAATALGYSQPAVSQMVRRLEERTGTVLVERIGRTVRLTEAGSVLAKHAIPVLEALDRAECEIQSIAGLEAGRVRLTAFPSASSTLVPQALALVKKRFPEIKVVFTEAEPPGALEALRAGECDLAVTFVYDGDVLPRGESDLDPFDVTTLLEDEVRLVLPASHPLATSDQVDLADLASESWIAGCPRCRGHLVSLAQRAGFEPDVAIETEDYVAVLALVAAGLGVAVVPELLLKSTRNDGLVALPMSPANRRTVQVVTTPDLRRVPAVEATLQALTESAKLAM
ncbi:LysR family transcriptional regulator [Demetria terragena]|uniref:LysR family transcriptional regulator n=1 Tax=Demetria terragena TaxID=63959 RepID=UPI0003703EA2|nr:LysR family transcriptional regulator [Demetria terragena]